MGNCIQKQSKRGPRDNPRESLQGEIDSHSYREKARSVNREKCPANIPFAKIKAAALKHNPIITAEQVDQCEQLFQAVNNSCFTNAPPNCSSAPVRRGWKTIRIFVSSTFTDMHWERESLVKNVFPVIRIFCEKYQLRVVECDLRWGVPAETSGDETLRICMSEIDRCKAENEYPFFINLLSDRYGWVPQADHTSDEIRSDYDWLLGLSVTHMEILHGAFRELNPNAFFLIRNSGYLKPLIESSGAQYLGNPPVAGAEMPTSVSVVDEQHASSLQRGFIDTGVAAAKLALLKEGIKMRFPKQHQLYSVTCDGSFDPDEKLIISGFSPDSTFVAATTAHLKRVISRQYPLDPNPPDVIQMERLAHDTFVESRGEMVLGRDQVLKDIFQYIRQAGDPTRAKRRPPLLVLGHAGAGKSALLARVARETISYGDDWLVFYHFVGATPGSTDLARLLYRVWKEVGMGQEAPKDLEQLMRGTPPLIDNTAAKLNKKIVFIIDALNQLDSDDGVPELEWLPARCPSNVSIVVSMIDKSEVHNILGAREPLPPAVPVGPLDSNAQNEIAVQYMASYNKKLDVTQLAMLTKKQDAGNPLWLLTACEELRLFGIFEKINEKIQLLPDRLLDLLQQVLDRVIAEGEGQLVTATVCLLESSRHGLLESEILQMLEAVDREPAYVEQDDDGTIKKMNERQSSLKNMDGALAEEVGQSVADSIKQQAHDDKVNFYRDEQGKVSKEEAEGREKVRKEKPRLPYIRWVPIYTALRRFLRPCGEMGGGRLDFYHRTVSKATRLKFFSGDSGMKYKLWWHGKLAAFFEDHNDELRRQEELPYHLEKVMDNNKLARVLVEWKMFESLLASDERRLDLLSWWRSIGGYAVADAASKAALENITDKVELPKREQQVGIFLGQVGQFDSADELLERCLAQSTELYGEESIERCECLMHLADVRELRRGSDSTVVGRLSLGTVQYARESVRLRKKLEKPVNERKLADTLFILVLNATEVAQAGGYPELNASDATSLARESAAQCLEIRTRINDPKAAEAALAIAAPYWPNDIESALTHFQSAFRLSMKSGGIVDLTTARIASNLGQCWSSLGHVDMATSAHCHAYTIRYNLLGDSHPRTQRSAKSYAGRVGQSHIHDAIEYWKAHGELLHSTHLAELG